MPLRAMGNLSLARQLLRAGPVDHQVLDGRLGLIEYRPTNRDIPRA